MVRSNSHCLYLGYCLDMGSHLTKWRQLRFGKPHIKEAHLETDPGIIVLTSAGSLAVESVTSRHNWPGNKKIYPHVYIVNQTHESDKFTEKDL